MNSNTLCWNASIRDLTPQRLFEVNRFAKPATSLLLLAYYKKQHQHISKLQSRDYVLFSISTMYIYGDLFLQINQTIIFSYRLPSSLPYYNFGKFVMKPNIFSILRRYSPRPFN